MKFVSALILLSLLLLTSCARNTSAEKKASAQKEKLVEVADNQHEGWWCDEHGIPEEECSMCNAKVAAECKKKGDWCEKHDRAKSQCFLCDPKLKEQYAAKYRAKYGKEPPPVEEKSNGPKDANRKG
jgi:hypothetical protein